ncbi:MAG: hypothetical protein AAFV87_00950 [Pseudomonadota bacterium]
MSEDVLAIVQASKGRRLLGVVAMWSLGILLLYVAMVEPPAIGWQLFLILMGAGAIWLAELMRRATALRLELTKTELRDSEGRILAQLDDIERVDRGVFAFKPSNGFLILRKSPAETAWRPGLWWRYGRRVGVGGMTSAAETKFMADAISTMLVEPEA